jgi:hypothetical protein
MSVGTGQTCAANQISNPEDRGPPAAADAGRCLQCPSAGAITARVAAIAQPVEHIIRNDGVGGSNPSCGTRT